MLEPARCWMAHPSPVGRISQSVPMGMRMAAGRDPGRGRCSITGRTRRSLLRGERALNVMLERLCHCLTDAVIDIVWDNISAGIGQAVLRVAGCGRFGTACRLPGGQACRPRGMRQPSSSGTSSRDPARGRRSIIGRMRTSVLQEGHGRLTRPAHSVGRISESVPMCMRPAAGRDLGRGRCSITGRIRRSVLRKKGVDV
jgi:hypothetical protein